MKISFLLFCVVVLQSLQPLELLVHPFCCSAMMLCLYIFSAIHDVSILYMVGRHVIGRYLAGFLQSVGSLDIK